ncbi:G2/mitotic-specific cyclin-1 [Spatholobus suberectus]|nr:G2/mitotic-specific cyclin-1 [Spatholobus suberectus]
MEAGQGCRQVLGDIGNLEVPRITEGKLVSRPITRNIHAKLSTNEQAEENLVEVLEVKANEQGAAQGKKNLIVPTLDDKAIIQEEHGAEGLTHKPNPEPQDVVSFEGGERANFVCERKSRERSPRNVKTLTSELTAQSKEACGVLIQAEDQPVDIDADDPNELAAAEYLDDIYRFFKLTELETENRASDYMESQHDINEMMRSITVNWLVDVHMRFQLMPETLFLTVNIIDRYLSSTIVSKEELQLLGISSMIIACKYEETWPPQVKDFISISHNAYTRNQILSMEKTILKRLEWHLAVPTPYVFLVRFTRAFGPPDEQMENMAFFLAELGLVHYQTAILFLPSMTAAAAVYAARCTLNKKPFWNDILKHRAGYTTEQLRDCAKLLVRLHSSVHDSKLKSVYQKFCSVDRAGVAFLSPPEDIEKTFIEN